VNVLHAIPAIADRYGGPSRVVLGMCRALQERGVNPLIATTDADGAGRLAVETGRPISYEGSQVIFFRRQFSEAFKYSRPLHRWLESNVARFDLVQIHAVFSHSSLAAARACLRQRVPYVVRPLGSLDCWSLTRKRLRKRLLWHLGVAEMVGNAAAMHYTSAEERRQSEIAVGSTPSVVIPLAVDDQLLNAKVARGEFRRRYPPIGDQPYVLALGRIHPVKGLELLLDSFLDAAREEEFKRWRLVIAGDGDAKYVENLKRRVQQRGSADRVLFTGWLEGAKKLEALRDAALFALPSLHENFGLSVAEALAFGVPVLISSSVGLAGHVESAAAGWVAELDRTSFRASLVEALREDGERSIRGAAARRLAESSFTWSAVSSQLIRFYEWSAGRRDSHEVVTTCSAT